MRRTSPQEFKVVLRLDAPARYRHFIGRVVDSRKAWGLWNNGWALAKDNDGIMLFPLWPAREYAEACRDAQWKDYEPEEIDLVDLIDELLPKLASDKILPAVFPDLEQKGVTPSIDQLDSDLREEMKKY